MVLAEGRLPHALTMILEPTIDVSDLPEHGFGHHEPIWWGNVVMIAIESTMFAMTVATILYLRGNFPEWPPHGTPPPDLGPATANLAVMLASLVPAVRSSRLAMHASRGRVTVIMWVVLAFCVATLALRAVEFRGLHCRWSDHAYGSIVWTILGLHTGHLLAATLETAVLLVYLGRRELDAHHRLDLTLDSLYWYFVVGSWVPLYALVYLYPRVTG
jgi:heme/copper-type cytochrome/quinol oxidase subunit 3